MLAPNINKAKGIDLIRKVSALIEYHFKIDPDSLTDLQFSEKWQRLKFALDFEDRRVSTDGKKEIHL